MLDWCPKTYYSGWTTNLSSVILHSLKLLHNDKQRRLSEEVFVWKFSIWHCVLHSRFDLIFLILDPQDELFDRKLANHLVSLYYQGTEEKEMEYMVCFFFRRIITTKPCCCLLDHRTFIFISKVYFYLS